ncbi:Cytochrome oxidase biogenesis protein Sco1/SenC/PrrC, thiol-disulfide reductase involved in Cu(I) insertion into CoxII Cu(A) center [hydrothermal vent metagenome]|uniref:Cytochrome oxidase biogenesis protein Sco1/SenC/PrrC, thiol-disulfide reductase involved in Cu(I) insertion into CoxII Cu(A) center n=1 Tax=hydrothermal vent metagenome TaxID=652676 RepID=A0A3B0RVQ6_9ZZZZ
MALASTFTVQPTFAGQDTPPPLASLFGGPFSLIDHNGQARTDKDFLGKFMLIYFGYTFCPNICPVNLQNNADAIKALGKKGEQIVPLFITTDPERDTVEVLKKHVANFGESLIGLTGTEQQISSVTKAYRIRRRKVVIPDEPDYLVDHTSFTFLMGPDGAFRTFFPHNTQVPVLVKAIGRYL